MARPRGSVDLQKRRAVLAAARALVAETGRSTSLAAIARRAGVSRQTIYNQFGDRPSLLRAATARPPGAAAASRTRVARTTRSRAGGDPQHRRPGPMTLQLGQTAPDFEADTTAGHIRFHEWLGDSWGLFFSHPKDFTPVCTTELGEVARLKPRLDQRGVKAIGLSVDPLDSHRRWDSDIEETQGVALNYPMIADPDRRIAELYGMIHPQADPSLTVRAVFVIDPRKTVRLILIYPPSTGRNFEEVLRAIDSLQLTTERQLATPVNWRPGEAAIIPPSLSEAEARARFPQGWRELKPYLRLVDLAS